MDPALASRPARLKALADALETRILVLDGAMGTMVQRYRLTEAEYRGERFRDFAHDLRGNNDLHTLTRPQVIREIHAQYLEAGADILETNTFNSTSVAQADYHLESIVGELNREAARLARSVADEYAARTPAKPRFVADRSLRNKKGKTAMDLVKDQLEQSGTIYFEADLRETMKLLSQ